MASDDILRFSRKCKNQWIEQHPEYQRAQQKVQAAKAKQFATPPWFADAGEFIRHAMESVEANRKGVRAAEEELARVTAMLDKQYREGIRNLVYQDADGSAPSTPRRKRG